MKTTISIAIATHDRPQCLRRAIDSIVAQEHKPLEIIVVNDGADEIDASLGDLCQSSGIPFIVERRHTPCLPASRNCAIDRASADVVLLLDDDCYLRSDYIARLASLYDADEEELVAAVGARIDDVPSRTFKGGIIKALSFVLGRGPWCGPRCKARHIRLNKSLAGRLVPVHRLTGGGISVRRQIARAHRFDERLGGWALFEDTEFCLRLGMSHGVFLAPQLKLWHDPGVGGRPNLHNRGRMYVCNFLHILKYSFPSGAGAWLLFFYGVGGIMTLYALLSMMSLHSRHLAFVAGAFGELLRHLGQWANAAIWGKGAAG